MLSSIFKKRDATSADGQDARVSNTRQDLSSPDRINPPEVNPDFRRPRPSAVYSNQMPPSHEYDRSVSVDTGMSQHLLKLRQEEEQHRDNEEMVDNSMEDYVRKAKKSAAYLRILLHSRSCTGACGRPACVKTSIVLKHMQNCLNVTACTFAGCVTSRKLLDHYEKCAHNAPHNHQQCNSPTSGTWSPTPGTSPITPPAAAAAAATTTTSTAATEMDTSAATTNTLPSGLNGDNKHFNNNNNNNNNNSSEKMGTFCLMCSLLSTGGGANNTAGNMPNESGERVVNAAVSAPAWTNISYFDQPRQAAFAGVSTSFAYGGGGGNGGARDPSKLPGSLTHRFIPRAHPVLHKHQKDDRNTSTGTGMASADRSSHAVEDRFRRRAISDCPPVAPHSVFFPENNAYAWDNNLHTSTRASASVIVVFDEVMDFNKVPFQDIPESYTDRHRSVSRSSFNGSTDVSASLVAAAAAATATSNCNSNSAGSMLMEYSSTPTPSATPVPIDMSGPSAVSGNCISSSSSSSSSYNSTSVSSLFNTTSGHPYSSGSSVIGIGEPPRKMRAKPATESEAFISRPTAAVHLT